MPDSRAAARKRWSDKMPWINLRIARAHIQRKAQNEYLTWQAFFGAKPRPDPQRREENFAGMEIL
jgi:hypothetical protein